MPRLVRELGDRGKIAATMVVTDATDGGGWVGACSFIFVLKNKYLIIKLTLELSRYLFTYFLFLELIKIVGFVCF